MKGLFNHATNLLIAIVATFIGGVLLYHYVANKQEAERHRELHDKDSEVINESENAVDTVGVNLNILNGDPSELPPDEDPVGVKNTDLHEREVVTKSSPEQSTEPLRKPATQTPQEIDKNVLEPQYVVDEKSPILISSLDTSVSVEFKEVESVEFVNLIIASRGRDVMRKPLMGPGGTISFETESGLYLAQVLGIQWVQKTVTLRITQ